MGDRKIKVDAKDEHVRLQANLVHRWRWQSDGQTDHAQQRRIRFAAVRKRVLRPEVTQNKDHLKDKWMRRKLVEVSM